MQQVIFIHNRSQINLGSGLFEDEPVKRTLSGRDREILWIRAGKKCQSCGNLIDYNEMQVGHKTAWSRGGTTTLRNSVCLCYGCNKRQGTDGWGKFQRKLGNQSASGRAIQGLNSLSLSQLRQLSRKHGLTVKGIIVEDFFSSYRAAPTKKQYINALSKVVSNSDIGSAKRRAKPAKKRRRRHSSSWSLW
jgi:hypothetical protein